MNPAQGIQSLQQGQQGHVGGSALSTGRAAHPASLVALPAARLRNSCTDVWCTTFICRAGMLGWPEVEQQAQAGSAHLRLAVRLVGPQRLGGGPVLACGRGAVAACCRHCCAVLRENQQADLPMALPSATASSKAWLLP